MYFLLRVIRINGQVSDIHAEKILILDFGSQTTQLIARRVREARVYCEIHPCTMTLEEIKKFGPRGIILSGGPASVYAPDAPTMAPGVLQLGVPILGICYGMQIITHLLDGRVARGERREYGPAQLQLKIAAGPFRELDITEQQKVWMSHGDRIEELPAGFEVLAVTENSPVAAMGDLKKHVYGVQFHPEVVHTPPGRGLAGRLCFGRMRLPAGVDHAQLRRGHHKRFQTVSGRAKGHLRPFRRGGFLGGGPFAAQGHRTGPHLGLRG